MSSLLRRADWRVVGESVLVLVGVVVCIYLIGFLVTWVRVVAAHLPVGASLPAIGTGARLTSGLLLVVVMTVV
ncbi:MAG: hypothetical protein JO286_05295, partial [Solirubrobacterales bacterium]|nr:hypothetical protein [Solirubrobacterales bacterium]